MGRERRPARPPSVQMMMMAADLTPCNRLSGT